MAEANFQSLYQFTGQLVKTLEDWISQGDLDKARDVVRYLHNAQIVEILASQTYQIGEPNWPLLRWKIEQLTLNCHPQIVNQG